MCISAHNAMANPTMAMRPTAALAKAVGTEAGFDVDDGFVE